MTELVVSRCHVLKGKSKYEYALLGSQIKEYDEGCGVPTCPAV